MPTVAANSFCLTCRGCAGTSRPLCVYDLLFFVELRTQVSNANGPPKCNHGETKRTLGGQPCGIEQRCKEFCVCANEQDHPNAILMKQRELWGGSLAALSSAVRFLCLLEGTRKDLCGTKRFSVSQFRGPQGIDQYSWRSAYQIGRAQLWLAFCARYWRTAFATSSFLAQSKPY